MDCPRKRQRRIHRGLVALLLGLTVASSAGGQAFQSSDTATVVFDPERVVIGNRFTIQIRTSIPWGEEVVIERPELNGPMVWWAYPYARSWKAEDEAGDARMVEVLAAVRVDRPGFHTIESFRIRAGDRVAVSERKDIIGLEADEADMPYPVFTEWRTQPDSVWQGQAVPVVLEAVNLSSLALADSTVLAAAPHGLLEEAPGLGSIVTRPHGEDILYDVPMGSWIWTQAEVGTYEFPDVRVSVAGLNRFQPGFPVEVKPVPDAALESGAVGRFRVDLEVEEGPYHVGEVVSVRMRVEGEGNMNVLNPPIPVMGGASMVGQGSSSSYIAGPLGYEGWREERFDFQVERSGDIEISVPAWAWWDPTGAGRLRRAAPESLSITVEEAAGTDGTDDVIRLLGSDAFRYGRAHFHWRNRHWYLLALPGFVLLVVMFLLRHPGHKVLGGALVLSLLLSAASVDAGFAARASRAASSGSNGNWAAAQEIYDSLMDDAGEEPGLLHDLAVTRMEQGFPDDAVALMRRALYLKPGSRRIAESLHRMERRLSLDDQVPVPLRWPPWVVFLALLLSINAVFGAMTRLLFRREGRDVIVAISAVLLLAFSFAATLYTDGLWKRSTAVVISESEPLRKIPGPLANDWIQLPAGSAVTIVASEGTDVLVRTGYGLEGWLPESSLKLISEAHDGL